MRVENSSYRYIGFTLIEILVVITIISLLVGIVMPSLSQAREQSKKAVCLSNLRSIGQGVQEYLDEHEDVYFYACRLPSAEEQLAEDQGREEYPPLPVALEKQLKGAADVFRCPSDRNTMDDQIPTRTYFEYETTSYEWFTEYNGKKVGHDPLTKLMGRRDAYLIWDFEAYHGGVEKTGSHHTLYADLSAREDEWDEEDHYTKTVRP
jgi:prepilin-type N-terminal cleavage/methylation domain-containing protein